MRFPWGTGIENIAGTRVLATFLQKSHSCSQKSIGPRRSRFRRDRGTRCRDPGRELWGYSFLGPTRTLQRYPLSGKKIIPPKQPKREGLRFHLEHALFSKESTGSLGGPLGTPGGPLEPSWGPLGLPWGHLEGPLGPPGVPWGPLGAILGIP